MSSTLPSPSSLLNGNTLSYMDATTPIQAVIPASLRFAPPSHPQDGRGVYFLLFQNGRFQGAPVAKFVLPINPEDFNYERQERVNVFQTIGNPFADEFGMGLPRINIRGVTGWRTQVSTGMDGYAAYKQLQQKIIDQYFQLREGNVKAAKDPDLVRLILLNCVDDLAFDVIPGRCRLLRNKQRPLLYQYDLNFIVLQDLTSNPQVQMIMDPLGYTLNWATSFLSHLPVLSNVVGYCEEIYNDAVGGVGLFCTAMSTFLSSTCSAIGLLTTGAGAVANLLCGIIASLDTGFTTIKESVGFQSLDLGTMVAVNHLYSMNNELNCYLNRGTTSDFVYPDFSRLYGASAAGSIFSGVVAGDLALSSTRNGLEWASNLRQATMNQGYAEIIGFSSSDNPAIQQSINVGNAPVMVADNLATLIDIMLQKVQNVNTTADLSQALIAMANVLNAVTFNPALIPQEDTNSIIQVSQVKTVRAGPGDSLQSIAYRELGNPDLWPEIVVANNLVVENIATILLPVGTFTFAANLLPGLNFLDFSELTAPFAPPGYLDTGTVVQLKDVNGLVQRLVVNSVMGSRVQFSDTFSQIFQQPVTITCYHNQGRLGVFDSITSLSEALGSGTRTLSVQEVKNIYPGFMLCVEAGGASQVLTVNTVDYLSGTVTVLEKNQSFPAGAQVLIYDTETQLHHLEVGTPLQIPIGPQSQSNQIQSAVELFGTDIALDAQGFLMFTPAGDLATVSGLANLGQALKNRLSCPYQSNPMNPLWGSGFESIKGESGSPAFIAAAKAAVVDSLSNEPRISQISQLTISVSGDTSEITVQAVPISSRGADDLIVSVAV